MDGTPLRRMPERTAPSRLDALVFSAKVGILRAQRLLHDGRSRPARPMRTDEFSAYPNALAQIRSPLWSDPRLAERAMQRGKVHNLRLAARRLDGLLIAPGTVFSFWRAVGPPLRIRGFVAGRMLQEGCLVASPGGGLCQLSNALYDAALRSGCEIVERHAHSRVVPGSLAQSGRDATVAWNYVDLRFRSLRPLLLRTRLNEAELEVALFAPNDAGRAEEPGVTTPVDVSRETANDCGSCGVSTCFRHGLGANEMAGRAAFLVDGWTPEFGGYLSRVQNTGDLLCVPIDGVKWKRRTYAWETHGLETCTAPLTTLVRALQSRRLATQGAARQRQLLRNADAMARALARRLGPGETDLYLAQDFLPWLWRNGTLGGRRFAVLMNRLPLHVLHARLDAAAQQFPDRLTLSDFRADAGRVAAEAEALAAAHAIITPHAEIAGLFGARAVQLDWSLPEPARKMRGPARRILFPGPVVARKGAFEVRAAARALDLEVVVAGAQLEGEDFWHGVRIARPAGTDTLDGVGAVVQPALVEERPRRLLGALAAGVPVVATAACGLPAQPGLTLIEPGDGAALVAALERVLPR